MYSLFMLTDLTILNIVYYIQTLFEVFSASILQRPDRVNADFS